MGDKISLTGGNRRGDTRTTSSFDFVKMGKIKEAEKKEHEEKLFTKEHEKRKEINELTYNVVQKATQEIAELKGLIDGTRLQEQDITKMRAFQHKDGRILLGSIEHVTKAFNKDRHHIDKADLDILEVGHEKDGIKRININDGLIEILKERGFKADIAKRGTNGELEKVGTVHAKWNKEKHGMDMNFEKYEGDQSNWKNGTSSHQCDFFIHIPGDKDDQKQLEDGSPKFESVITIPIENSPDSAVIPNADATNTTKDGTVIPNADATNTTKDGTKISEAK